MNQEQILRHWLAMHCPSSEAGNIWNQLYDAWLSEYRRKQFGMTEKPTMELCRFVWADKMLQAGAVPTRSFLAAMTD